VSGRRPKAGLDAEPELRLGHGRLNLSNCLANIAASLLLLSVRGLHADGEVGPTFAMVKEIQSQQSDSNPPTLKSNPYRFTAQAQQTTIGSISSGTVSLPAGSGAPSPETLTSLGIVFQLEQKYADLTSLNSQFADGAYQLQITGASSTTYHASLAITGGVYPSVTPQVTNSGWTTGALLVDPAFTLTWTGFSGSTPSDKIAIYVQNDAKDQTLFFLILPATATSQSFATLSLPVNQIYNFSIAFIKVTATDTTDITGATGYGGYITANSFVVATPQLRTTAVSKTNSGANVLLQTTSVGIANLSYSVQSVTNLQQSFQLFGTAVADANGTIPYNPPGTSEAHRFYKITYP
jgi:hypothetical protein